MKIYSEKTKKFYDTIKECNKAEKEFDEAKAAKDAELAEFRAKKKEAAEVINKKAELVQAKFEEARQLQKEYYKEVEEFNKKFKEPVRTVVRTNIVDPWDLFDEATQQLSLFDQVFGPFLGSR